MKRILRTLRRALHPIAAACRRAARMLRRSRRPLHAPVRLALTRPPHPAEASSTTVRWLLVWITHRRPPLPGMRTPARTGQRPGHQARGAHPMRT